MDLKKISKKMSYLLRHSTDPQYVSSDGGWADTDVIIQALKKSYPQTDLNTVIRIVDSDEKGRYSFSDDKSKIRANQGHSIPGVTVKMEKPDPPEYLYHGTATRFLESIMHEGLKPQSRQFVHISPDYETALKVGARHGKPVVLRIEAERFVHDGNDLYRSSNGVWQAKEVPPEYFTLCDKG